jgi:hypothetical protein
MEENKNAIFIHLRSPRKILVNCNTECPIVLTKKLSNDDPKFIVILTFYTIVNVFIFSLIRNCRSALFLCVNIYFIAKCPYSCLKYQH